MLEPMKLRPRLRALEALMRQWNGMGCNDARCGKPRLAVSLITFRGAGLLPGVRPLFPARKHRPEGRRQEKFSRSMRTLQNPKREITHPHLVYLTHGNGFTPSLSPFSADSF